MEIYIAIAVSIFVIVAFLPYNQMITKNNLKNLKGNIYDEDIDELTISANELIERIFRYTEKYYSFLKNRIKPDLYKKYTKDLIVAGLTEKVNPEGIICAKYFLSIVIMGYLIICALLFGLFFLFLMAPVGLIIGYIYPDIYLKGIIKKRQLKIQKELPNVLNTLAIISDAGLGLFESIEKVCEMRTGEFINELKKVNEEVRMGVIRKEAFLRLSDRCQVNEVSTFVSALVQLMEKGTSGISKFLKEASNELWNKRINRAKEIGSKAAIKLFFPMLVLVLPATLIFLSGPVIIQIISKLF